jgi:hypothetical protein
MVGDGLCAVGIGVPEHYQEVANTLGEQRRESGAR